MRGVIGKCLYQNATGHGLLLSLNLHVPLVLTNNDHEYLARDLC
jgi:hypothetical protein